MCLRRHRRRPSVSAYFTLGDDNLYCSVMFVMAIKRLGTNLAPRNVRSHVAQFGRSYIYSFLCVFLSQMEVLHGTFIPKLVVLQWSAVVPHHENRLLQNTFRVTPHVPIRTFPAPMWAGANPHTRGNSKVWVCLQKSVFRENCVYRKGANSFGDAPLPLALFSRTHVLMWREERD